VGWEMLEEPVGVGDNGGKGGRWERVDDTCMASTWIINS
jgi:hypothetical protein